MDEKTLVTLEYFKILERLAGYAAFSASADLARALRPTNDLEEAVSRQSRTREARLLLDTNADITVGGARDVRSLTQLAQRGGVLDAAQLLDIKATMIAARTLSRALEKQNLLCPGLSGLSERLMPPSGVVDAISQAISERGDVLDSASPKLAATRREIKIAHDRLMARLDRILNDPRVAPMLQEALITQRGGRYVVPLRAEFKGRIRSIIHDQSSSGATLFVEPLVVVELNNHWHEQQLVERDEVRRILSELSAVVGDYAERIRVIVDAMAELDMALACAKYAEDLHASEPVLLPIHTTREDHPGSTVTLYHARHPLLDPETVVPVDIDLDENTYSLVITGPNTGGKTVTLKTVGLLALMAQSGLQIPAQSGSRLSIFRDVYADIGDEQSIEQSLSTFSGHVTNIVRILQHIDAKTLVLFDELGAGTDPQEGAALARAILGYLLKRRTTCFIATHYPELKAYAHSTPGVVNASMEFNVKTLRPTYHLTVGLPGRSNALLIAERLGLSKEIIEDARSVIDPNDLRAEDLLDEIHHQRDVARRARSAADRARSEVENMRNELARRLEKLEDERLVVLEKTRRQAAEEVEALRAELDEVRRTLSRARQPVEALAVLEDKVEKLEDSVQKPVERQTVQTGIRGSNAPRPLKLGDKVRLRSVSTPGIITAMGESEVEVQVGNLRVRARLTDIHRPNEEEQPAEPAVTRVVSARQAQQTAATPFRASPGMELDIRGQRAEDALDALDNYLESAALAGMPFVRIIHGKGTGRLRVVIREALQRSEYVGSFE
ncbi:MAG TPA: endonuclease MutS2, partial [Anaerolineaceae bacterium]|nr:endonuclease MutS2 [Anaerolineaceae bacterium]